jgi:phosphatidyl-myo-inositol alpha-mannosyltransferase
MSAKHLKIGIVCPYDMFRGGGVQEFVKALQHGLERRGHMVIVITPKPRHYEGTIPPNYKLIGTSARFNTPLQTLVDVTAGIDSDEVSEYLLEQQFDILHFQEPWVPDLGRQLLSRSNTLNLATFHAALPPTAMSRSIERVAVPYTRSALKYLDQLVAVSDPAASYVRSQSDAPIIIIPNGIDLTKYHAPKKRPVHSVKQIFYVGRLEKRKGVRYLIEAVAHLQQWHPEISLLIGGDGPLREQLEEYARDKNVDAQFLGYLSDADKIHLLQSADLFVAPAIHGESFGIVLLEAMACGIPIIAGDNPGYRSVMNGIGSVSLVNPRHSLDMARRMELLLYTPELRELWLQWAKEYVKQFDYERIIDQYEVLYKRTVESKPHRRPERDQ